MSEVRIKTDFGEVAIPYSNVEELAKGLDELPAVVAQVRSKVGGIASIETRKPKPGSEQIYRFGPDGKLELFAKPGTKVALAALTLYAYDPEALAASELEVVSGLPDIVHKVLRGGSNAKYFDLKPEGKWGLSTVGFQWVTDHVLPELKAPPTSGQR
jgi:hypothetical protein